MTCRCGSRWWTNLHKAVIDGKDRLVRRCKVCGWYMNDAKAEETSKLQPA